MIWYWFSIYWHFLTNTQKTFSDPLPRKPKQIAFVNLNFWHESILFRCKCVRILAVDRVRRAGGRDLLPSAPPPAAATPPLSYARGQCTAVASLQFRRGERTYLVQYKLYQREWRKDKNPYVILGHSKFTLLESRVPNYKLVYKKAVSTCFGMFWAQFQKEGGVFPSFNQCPEQPASALVYSKKWPTCRHYRGVGVDKTLSPTFCRIVCAGACCQQGTIHTESADNVPHIVGEFSV